jgi:hypothetical protein
LVRSKEAYMHKELPEADREWVITRAEAMGLPDADNYLLLLVRLEKQRLELAAWQETLRLWKAEAKKPLTLA